MAIAVGSISNTPTYGNRTNSTFTAPTGITNGDLLVAVLHVGNGSLTPLTVTGPTGFAEVPNSPTSFSNPDPYSISTHVFYKVASSESGNYTFTHSAGDTEGYMYRLTGADTSTPIDVTPVKTVFVAASGTGKTTTYGSITTATNGAFLIFGESNWDGVGSGAVSGTTPSISVRRAGTISWIGDGTLATAGATSSRTRTNGNTDPNSPWASIVVAIRPATGGGGSTTPKTITVSSTSSATFLRSTGKKAAITSTSATALVKGAGKIVAAISTTTTTFKRAVAKAVAATSTTASAVTRAVSKTIAATSSTSAAINAMRAFLITISASLSSATSIARQSGKVVSASLTSATTAQKAIARSVAFLSSGAVTVAKGATKAFSTTSSSSASVTRSFIKSITITATVSLGAAVNAVFNLAAPFVARLINPFGGLAMATTANTAASYIAVTPSDSVPLPGPCIALYIGVSGDVTVKQNAGAAAVTFKSVPVGVLGVGAYQVMATGTAATNILALY